MRKPRLSIRISPVGQDLLRQLARTLGVTMTTATEISVREKAISLGLTSTVDPGPVRRGVARDNPYC
jgi:hypothetical protein